MNRLALVLSYEVSNCIKPSRIIGIINTKEVVTLQRKKKQENSENIIPTNSPVHLAQIGNFLL